MYESLVGVIYKPRGQLLRQSVDSLNCQIRGRREVSGREPLHVPCEFRRDQAAAAAER